MKYCCLFENQQNIFGCKRKKMLRNRKTVRDPISGSDMRAANYRALLVDIPSFVPAIPQERDSR